MGWKKWFGILLFVKGIIFVILMKSGITGNVISTRASAVRSVVGLVLIIGGLLLFESEDATKIFSL